MYNNLEILTSQVYTCFSAKHKEVALITYFNSVLEESIKCRATNNSVGVTKI